MMVRAFVPSGVGEHAGTASTLVRSARCAGWDSPGGGSGAEPLTYTRPAEQVAAWGVSARDSQRLTPPSSWL